MFQRSSTSRSFAAFRQDPWSSGAIFVRVIAFIALGIVSLVDEVTATHVTALSLGWQGVFGARQSSVIRTNYPRALRTAGRGPRTRCDIADSEHRQLLIVDPNRRTSIWQT